MRKVGDWNSKLFEFIKDKYDTPFKWGVWDCCRFTNAAIRAMTGEDLIPPTLAWTNKKTALAAIKEYGGTLAGCIDRAATSKGLKPISSDFMTAGDLVVFKETKGSLVGICDGFRTLAPSDDGIELKDNNLAIQIWRIP